MYIYTLYVSTKVSLFLLDSLPPELHVCVVSKRLGHSGGLGLAGNVGGSDNQCTFVNVWIKLAKTVYTEGALYMYTYMYLDNSKGRWTNAGGCHFNAE